MSNPRTLMQGSWRSAPRAPTLRILSRLPMPQTCSLIRLYAGEHKSVDGSRHSRNVIVYSGRFPNQADTLFNPKERGDLLIPVQEKATRSIADLDYLQELLAIQQNENPKNLGFFGTRNMGLTHQKLVEVLSYAMVTTGNHIYTSGATGTNAAVIKGALRADAPELLTVILPQSRSKQPQESQELLAEVQNVVEMSQNDELTLLEASRICNREITSRVQQVICFAFHDSRLLLETCSEAKDLKKIVTLFYLD